MGLEECLFFGSLAVITVLHWVNHLLDKITERNQKILELYKKYTEACHALAHSFPSVDIFSKIIAATETSSTGTITINFSEHQIALIYDARVAMQNFMDGEPQQPLKESESIGEEA